MSSPVTSHSLNSNGLAGGLNVSPTGLTRERMSVIFQRAKQLQASGATEDSNPEYAQLLTVLRQLQQQSVMKAQQQQYHLLNGVTNQNSTAQQPAFPQFQQVAQPSSSIQTQQAFSQQTQQTQQTQQAQQAQHVPDASSSTSSLFSQYGANRTVPLMSNQTVANSATAATSVTPSQTAFTSAQLAALKYQILAFKLISKNMPVPPPLQQAIFSPANVETMVKDQPPTLPSKITDAAYAQHVSTQSLGAGQTPLPSVASNSQTNGIPLSAASYNAYTSPYSLLKKQISSYAHASRQQRLLIPSLSPIGLDPYALAQERERRVKARVEYRISELEKLPSNLANVPLRELDEEPEHDIRKLPSAKMRAIIELKALRLLQKQKRLREEIVKGMTKATMLATSVDRAAYRRMKKQSLREARMTEKLERQQRVDREKREKQKHLDYLQTICAHGADMVRHHKVHQARQSKLGRGVLQFHAHIEKEEQKRAERISKERLRALRNDDEEAYLKLIDEAKDTRLTHLLRQTGAYLESLSQAVIAQQNEHAESDDLLKDDELKDEDGEGLTFEIEGKKVDYFQIAHRIKESVEQPDMLNGGTLKEYQLKGLQWMVSLYNNRLNGILADEMGLGKTIQTISLITYLIERKKQNGPFLIIVPLSVLTNWTIEFEKWAPDVIKVVYKGVPEVRKIIQQTEIRHSNFQVLLTTYEYIIKDRPVLSKIKWVHMIIDEGHRMKNSKSKLTSVLAQYYNTRYRMILTGTPLQSYVFNLTTRPNDLNLYLMFESLSLQNNLPELWALLNFVLPKIFNSVKGFEEWFNTPFANSGGQDKMELNEEEQLLIIKRLHKVLRPFLLRRLKKDVESELPDKVEKVVKCKFSALQAKLYHQMKRHGMLYTAGGEKGRTGIKGLNNTIMQLRKICNHPFVFEDVENLINPLHINNETLYRVSGKFELLDRILPKLKATGHRVSLVSDYD
ncbi:SNF2 family N-terminal domain-containing protein, partial [Endogone sp. FLAS-F59071]